MPGGLKGGMLLSMKGKGKGKRWPSGPHLARERISTEPVTGEVLEWKGSASTAVGVGMPGKYGWIKPTVPIDHPMADRHKAAEM